MNNFIAPGKVITLTAPAGGVVSGGGYQVGQFFSVAASDAAAGEEFEGQVDGVFDLAKTAGDAPAKGALVYWNAVASEVTVTAATGNLLIGAATVAAAGGDVTVRVRLNGIAQANEP